MLASERDQQSQTLIFLPAWNEGESIETVIADVQEELPGATILVIDDGSHDDTVDAARQAGAEVAILPFHIGLGAALQTGYRYAQENGFKYFAHLDSDGQHPPNQLPRILTAPMRWLLLRSLPTGIPTIIRVFPHWASSLRPLLKK